MLKAIFDTYKVSADWLLSGQGPMYRQPATGNPEPEPPPDKGLSEHEKKLLAMLRALPEDEQQRVEGHLKERQMLVEIREKVREVERIMKAA